MRILLALALCTGAFAQCSIESIHGTWATRRLGVTMVAPPNGGAATPVPIANLGIAKFDLTGGFTLKGFVNIGGQVAPVDASGTIQVDPSCTATASFTVAGTTVSNRLVIVGNGTEMRMLQTSGGATGISEFRRISWGDAQCTQDMLHGVYLGYSEGTVIAPIPPSKEPVPLPMSGLFASVDQWGVASTVGTMSVMGYPGPWEAARITATVNPDCTGANESGGATQFLIVLDNGNEMWLMPTKNPAAPTIAISRVTRVSPVAVTPKW